MEATLHFSRGVVAGGGGGMVVVVVVVGYPKEKIMPAEVRVAIVTNTNNCIPAPVANHIKNRRRLA